ncbi:MAG: phosphotransferase [Canibacter sp.]
MATSPFTLAALATSAVPDLVATSVRVHTSDEEGAFESAVIATDETEMIVRIPQSGSAEVRQSAEILGQSALTSGARTFLPFEVPETLGMTRAGDSRAVVSTFIPGGKFHVADLTADAIVLQSIGEAIAAIHELPLSTVQQAGLPIRSAENCRIETARLVDRAAQTRMLPNLVQDRWISALQDKSAWDFAPVVVHGGLNDDEILIEDDTVVGVLGFDRLSVGDPAADLAWLIGAGPDIFEQVVRFYAAGVASENQHLRKRAQLLHELEIAEWLVHGVDTHDDEIVNDAVAMLDRLVDRLAFEEEADESAPPNAEQVAEMLDETPEITQMRTDTQAYEGWDDERVFDVDADFADTGVVEVDQASEAPHGTEVRNTGPTQEAPEHETEVIDTGVVEASEVDETDSSSTILEDESDLHTPDESQDD